MTEPLRLVIKHIVPDETTKFYVRNVGRIIGYAFKTHDGSINLKLDAVPLTGVIHICDHGSKLCPLEDS